VSAVAHTAAAPQVVLLADLEPSDAEALVRAYRARLVVLAAGAAIPGSYWGAPEAGLVGDNVYARHDTPVHSLLHELSHYVCMDAERRVALATDAFGSDDEECAVCYLQLVLADTLPRFGRERCLADMDAWGYSFREGSASAWFSGDARFARNWLLDRGLIDQAHRPTFRLRA
jgi:hypothetical protein